MSRDPTEIIQYAFQFAAQETFIITINVENSFAALYFVETMIHSHSKVWGKKKKIIITFIQQVYIKFIKTVKDIYNVRRD